jgi:hypothetical protein
MRCRFSKFFVGGGHMDGVRRAVVVEAESPPLQLYAVEKPV